MFPQQHTFQVKKNIAPHIEVKPSMIKKYTLLGDYQGPPLIIPHKLIFVLSTNEDSTSSTQNIDSPTSQEQLTPPSPNMHAYEGVPSQRMVRKFINMPLSFPPLGIVATTQLPNLTLGYLFHIYTRHDLIPPHHNPSLFKWILFDLMT